MCLKSGGLQKSPLVRVYIDAKCSNSAWGNMDNLTRSFRIRLRLVNDVAEKCPGFSEKAHHLAVIYKV